MRVLESLLCACVQRSEGHVFPRMRGMASHLGSKAKSKVTLRVVRVRVYSYTLCFMVLYHGTNHKPLPL